MKKYFILMSAALVALSCAKELADPQEASKNDNGEYKTITFSSIATKTTLDEGTGDVAWEEGDEISIYYINAAGKPAEVVAKAASAAATTTFTAQIPVEDNPTEYYAAYPKGNGILTEPTNDESGSTPASFAINVSANTDGTFKSANFAAAYTTAENMSFSFKNAVGIIKATIPDGGIIMRGDDEYPITGVYIRCKSDSHPLNGTLAVTVTDGVVSDFGEATGSANLNMTSLSPDVVKSGTVYIPCTPVAWSDGICIDYMSSAGNLPAVATQDKTVEVSRGVVLSLPDVSSKIRWDYYFDAEVTEDGEMTQDNPGSLAQAKALLNNTKIYWNRVMAGVTLHFANGTYNFERSQWPIQFHATDLPLVTIEGGDAVVFDGNKGEEDATATSRLLNISGAANLVVKNVKFQNSTSTKGGAMQILAGKVRFENCSFVNNNSSTAGVSFMQNAEVSFDNCKFTENSGNNGSVLALNTATVKLNGCAFVKNEATGDNGGVIYGATAPVAFLNSCYFTDNTKAYKQGICVHFNATVCKLGMNNVTIDGGTATKTQNQQVLCKGYSVISNSTIWATDCTWGVFGMGYNGNVKGAVLVNNILCNKNQSEAGIGTNQNYQLRSAYNIISNVTALGAGNNISTYESEGCVTGMFNGGKPFTYVTPEKASHNLYTWDGTLDACTDELTGTLTKPSLADVEAEILKADSIGEDFLKWLKSIENENGKNALEVDSRGVERNTAAMWPGAYQNDIVTPAN